MAFLNGIPVRLEVVSPAVAADAGTTVALGV